MTQKKNRCEAKKCLLLDRAENIAAYIEKEISTILKKLQEDNPDAHAGCLQSLIKKELDYQSIKIIVDLTEQYPEIMQKDLQI